jgi:inorganic triphosphatase YgiF
MFLEIELKLSIAPVHTHLLYHHPLLAQQHAPSSEQLVSRYFDTPDLSLWRQGLSLRIREAAGCTIQTLKTAGERIGQLHHRHEWEQPIQDTLPNIHAFTDSEISKKLDSIIGKQALIELFHTNFARTQWILHTEESTQIELVLDLGVVKTATQQMPLHEIELELKQGDSNQLYPIAALLKQTIPLTLETRSKAERGYLLYTDNNLSATHV